MRQIPYYVVTTLTVQIGFITTLLYCVPVMHGIWRSRILPIVQWLLYVGFAWTLMWPFLAGIVAMWFYVTCVSFYFMHEAWTLHDMSQYRQRRAAPSSAPILQF